MPNGHIQKGPREGHEQKLFKNDYDYLVRQASRGALLCEFLANRGSFAVEAHTIKRYLRELRGIESSIASTVSHLHPTDVS